MATALALWCCVKMRWDNARQGVNIMLGSKYIRNGFQRMGWRNWYYVPWTKGAGRRFQEEEFTQKGEIG